MQYFLVHGSLKVSRRHIHWRIYSWLEVGTRWRRCCTMMVVNDHYRYAMWTMYLTAYFCSNTQSC